MHNVTITTAELTAIVRIARDQVFSRADLVARYGTDPAGDPLYPAPIKVAGKECWPLDVVRDYEDRLANRTDDE